MPSYQELKAELGTIQNLIKGFPEEIQSKAFDLLIESFLAGAPVKLPEKDVKIVKVAQPKAPTKKTKKPSNKKQSYSIVKELNLNGGKGKQSFGEFLKAKEPNSAIHFNAASVYYLKKIAGLDKVGINHVYTCYKNANRKPPADLVQSIWDTSGNKYGYIDAASVEDINIPHIGVSFVEHDLPKKKTSKSSTK